MPPERAMAQHQDTDRIHAEDRIDNDNLTRFRNMISSKVTNVILLTGGPGKTTMMPAIASDILQKSFGRVLVIEPTVLAARYAHEYMNAPGGFESGWFANRVHLQTGSEDRLDEDAPLTYTTPQVYWSWFIRDFRMDKSTSLFFDFNVVFIDINARPVAIERLLIAVKSVRERASSPIHFVLSATSR
ncbi:hypothetical protein PVAG01_07542 [Phlyctema vagabunda]|uniref:Uncharacterized protein n=1 Tax=Phlyctema vagabunda TaxID=108571 RepID=A0ABR4PCR6_9HELO